MVALPMAFTTTMAAYDMTAARNPRWPSQCLLSSWRVVAPVPPPTLPQRKFAMRGRLGGLIAEIR